MAVQCVIPEIIPTFECGDCGNESAETSQCSNCDTCESCCECQTCGDCGTLTTEYCGTCDNCHSCCGCLICSYCAERVAADEDSFCSLCDRCEDCCDRRGDCYTCSGCARRRSHDSYSQCESCNYCSNCCECFHCANCGDTCESDCGECSCCRDCCNCSRSSRDSVLTKGKLTFHTATKLQHKVNVSKRHISLELEIAADNGEGAEHVLPIAERWLDAIVEDGSLPETGYEINTNPTSGDLFIKHVTALCDGLKDSEATVTRACGMHCHVSAAGYSYFDLFKLCRLYGSVESALFSLVASSRRSNHYTERCAERYTFERYTTFKKDLLRALYGDQCLEIQSSYYSDLKKPRTKLHRGKQRLEDSANKYTSARYCALNLHSFFYRGTIEFRHHQGTTNAYKATRWGMLCAAIIDAASRLSISQIDALPTDSFERLLAILPSEELRSYAKLRRDELSTSTY